MRRLTKPVAAAMFAGLLTIPALSGCSSSSSTSESSSAASVSAADSSSPAAQATTGVAPLQTGGAALADTKWALSGASYATGSLAETGISLEFTATEISGNAGVNNYHASYTSSADGKLEFGPIASTKMSGDETANKAEAAYLQALGSVTGYSGNGDLLDLFAGPDQVLTFTRA